MCRGSDNFDIFNLSALGREILITVKTKTSPFYYFVGIHPTGKSDTLNESAAQTATSESIDLQILSIVFVWWLRQFWHFQPVVTGPWNFNHCQSKNLAEPLFWLYSSIELYGREHELRTIPLEPLVVLWFSQRPHRRWQTGARRFHSPTRAVCAASSTNMAARRKPWSSQSVAASTGFSRSKMLPIQLRNPIWTSLTWVMWLFRVRFLYLLSRRKPGTFLVGLVPGEADAFRNFNYDVTNSCSWHKRFVPSNRLVTVLMTLSESASWCLQNVLHTNFDCNLIQEQSNRLGT